MKLGTQEHYDLMAQFEVQQKGRRLDHELKHFWPQGIVYQDGEVNALFIAFRQGYALGIAKARSEVA